MNKEIRSKIERYGYKTERVSVKLIKANRYRSEGLGYKSEVERTEDLMKLIKKNGLWLSVMGTWVSDSHGTITAFELIYGHKRVEAVKKLSLEKIDVITIKGNLTELERINIMADENYANKYASSINLITIIDVEKAVKGLVESYKNRDSFINCYSDFKNIFHNSALFNEFKAGSMSALIEVILLVLNHGCDFNEEIWHIDTVEEAILLNRDRNLRPTLKLLSNPYQASECLNAVKANRDAIPEKKVNEVIRKAINKIEVKKQDLSGRKLSENIYEIADEFRYPDRSERDKQKIDALNKEMRGIKHSCDSLTRRIVGVEGNEYRQEVAEDVNRLYVSTLSNLVRQLIKNGVIEIDKFIKYKKLV